MRFIIFRNLKVNKPFYYKNKLPEEESNLEENNNINNCSFNLYYNKNKSKAFFNFKSNTVGNIIDQKAKRKKKTETDSNLLSNKNNKTEKDTILEYFINLANENINILELIFITLFSLDSIKNIEKITLIFNESYFYEYSSYFRNSTKIAIGNTHILDFIYNSFLNINTLNIELNSFDLLAFNRLLKILYNNNNLSSFKCSFFSSDCTYFPPAIHKIDNQNTFTKFIKIKENDNKKDLNCRIEEPFFRNIYINFERNLKYFFGIIKIKKLKILGLNFDIPPPVLNDEKYVIVITKFILNIILFCINSNNNESTIEELIILSPYLIINSKRFLFFDNFLQNIHNNKCLKKLNLQIKLYNISNIHKLLSEKLKIINIGDFDIFSLKIFVDNLTQYNFCKISSLEHIGISLNQTIIHLDEELKLILAKLFNIKIKNLSSINLFSNIDINENEEFEEIINLLNDNWIPTYLILLNDKYNNIINKNSQLLEQVKYISNKIKRNNNKNKSNENNNNSDAIFRCLKLIFNKRNGFDFYSKKKIISKILKYLYICKPVNISFDLEKDKKDEIYNS